MEESGRLLFGPMNEKDLRRQYPELLSVEEFKKLSVGEMLFVWWYANPTSPLVTNENLPEKIRATDAYKKAFKSCTDDARKKNYYSLNFPDKVKLAVDRMIKYSPSARAKSRLIVETIFRKYEEMVDVNLSDFEEEDAEGNKTVNWAGRNSYVNSTAKISEILPHLIRQIEEGFGVVDTKGDEVGTKAIHRFHSVKTD